MGANAVSGYLAGLSAITHAAAFVFIVIATARRWGRWHGVNRRFADVYGCARGGIDGYGFVDSGLRLKRQVYFGIASEWGFAVCAGGERESDGENAPVHDGVLDAADGVDCIRLKSA